MIMYLCARDIDVSSFYTFSIDQARRENDHVFVFLEISMFPISTPFLFTTPGERMIMIFVC